MNKLVYTKCYIGIFALYYSLVTELMEIDDF